MKNHKKQLTAYEILLAHNKALEEEIRKTKKFFKDLEEGKIKNPPILKIEKIKW